MVQDLTGLMMQEPEVQVAVALLEIILDMEDTEPLVKEAMVEANKQMGMDDVSAVLNMGLPVIMKAIEDNHNQEVVTDAKEVFIGMIDGLERNGVSLKPNSPLKNDYDKYVAELAPKDNKVSSALSSMFENISMSDILNAPPLARQPNK